MKNDKSEYPGVVEAVSRFVGDFVGTLVVGGKEMANCVKDMTKPKLEPGPEPTPKPELKPEVEPMQKLEPASTGSKAKLEADLAAAQRQLEEIRDEAKKAQSQFESQLKDMQAENKSLLSELETAQKDAKEADEITNRANALDEQVAALKSELATTQQELTETRNQAEKAQSQLASQVKDLQVEKENLISDLEKARSETDGMTSRGEQVNGQVAKLESELAIARQELADTQSQAEHTQTQLNKQLRDMQAEIAVVPMEMKNESSIEAGATQEEPIGAIVENVEEPELKSEAQADPEVEAAKSAEVTAEQMQAADFKNEADRIIFTKAFSDFDSKDAIARADAAAVLADIHHELSPRLLITHMADEPSAYVRQECIKALTALEMEEGAGAIERALADEVASVRLAAVWGLYRLVGAESIPALTPMLSDRDASVRRRAITCIGWLGEKVGTGGNHLSHKVVSALVQCLGDRSESIKNAALDTLQTVTGKKMSAPRTCPERLIEQWRSWWKDELLR